MESRQKWLIAGSICSLVLIAILFFLQSRQSPILELETRWVAFATLPLLVALIVGGFIHKFKGFGIELETLLRNPVSAANLVATDASEVVSGGEKRSLRFLNRLTEDEILRFERLTFVERKTGYYDRGVIVEYLRRLHKLRYLEISRNDGRFVCLIPPSALMENERPSTQRIREFIEAVEKGTVVEAFRHYAITETVGTDESLIDVLPRVRSSRGGYLPVTSPENLLTGVITTEAVEKRIADEVLMARRRA
jgi:hypothetical protein